MTVTQFKPTKWTFLFLMLAAMMILMGGAAVAPALPLISQAFPDASDASISLIVTLPALAIAITGLFLGILSDKIGKIRVLAASVAVFTIAGSSGYYLTSIPAILAGRFILGIGIAGIICTTSALIVCYYDGISRARVLGYQAAAMGVGVLILETSGGLLAGISWRAAFLIYLLGVLIFFGVLLTMKEPVRKCEESKAAPGETKTAPGETFPITPLLLAYVTLFMGNLLFFLMPTKFPYLIANMDAARILGENTALTAGIFLGIGGCASAILGIFYGRIAWRFHRYTILTVTLLAFGLGLCILGFATSLVMVGLAVILVGVGEGLLMPTILTWIAAITPQQFLGRAMGGFSVSLNIGQFASALAVVPVIALVTTYGNMFLAFGCMALVLAVPYVVALIKEKYYPVQAAPIDLPLAAQK
ncbi:MFS transporter [Methanoregula sp.]|uniref:MFS transporter n=1 Tax=Methanoregula sp. TaxID=2052170 RepID=UPI00237156BA|nr:MFS transporter [Methanoregula sp.]MDD1687029.1 MFS transporter [Methanoregula sp.]